MAMIVRLFGVFLVVWATSDLPRAVYVTAATGDGSFLAVLLIGIIPVIVPAIIGIFLAKWPGVLAGSIGAERENFFTEKFCFSVLAIALMGIYLSIKAALDIFFQASMSVLTYNSKGVFFGDIESMANAMVSVLELLFGIVLLSKRFIIGRWVNE